MTVPRSQQRLQRDLVDDIRIALARGEPVPGELLLSAIEQQMGPLPEDLRGPVLASSIPAVRRKGRRRNNRGVEDFLMKEIEKRYAKLLREFQSEPSDRSRPDYAPPSERAYRKLATEMSEQLGNMDWLALRNKHSAWKTGRFYSSEGFVDSEDFDAEIERQFPTHKK